MKSHYTFSYAVHHSFSTFTDKKLHKIAFSTLCFATYYTFFCLFVCLLIWKAEWQKEKYLVSARSSPTCFQQPELGQSTVRRPDFWDSYTWVAVTQAILFYLPRYTLTGRWIRSAVSRTQTRTLVWGTGSQAAA